MPPSDGEYLFSKGMWDREELTRKNEWNLHGLKNSIANGVLASVSIMTFLSTTEIGKERRCPEFKNRQAALEHTRNETCDWPPQLLPGGSIDDAMDGAFVCESCQLVVEDKGLRAALSSLAVLGNLEW